MFIHGRLSRSSFFIIDPDKKKTARPEKIRSVRNPQILGQVPLLYALDQQLIVSSAAPLKSLILVNRETLLQACLLPVTLYAVIFLLASVQVQCGGVAILRWFLACLQASSTVLLTLLLPLRRRAVVTTCPRKVKHRISGISDPHEGRGAGGASTSRAIPHDVLMCNSPSDPDVSRADSHARVQQCLAV